MTIVRSDDATLHTMHGSTFASYVAPARGSEQLCAWRLEIPAHIAGVEHVVSHEEVLLVLSGTLRATVDGESAEASTGDVVCVPAGGRFRVDTDADGVRAWVVTSVGLHARTADGKRITPPWAR